jgi:alpha-N-arabinofuranosidase
MGLYNNPSGDDRYYNNIFVNGGLQAYNEASLPVYMAGNVFLQGAAASKHEKDPLVDREFDPGIKIIQEEDSYFLAIMTDKAWAENQSLQLVTTERLGRAKIPDLPYEQPDGTPYQIDTDYFGSKRNSANPFPGPFEIAEDGILKLKVWPVSKIL